MKTIKIILVAFLAMALGASSYAQTPDLSKLTNTKTEILKVSGKCDMCKARIEKAAKLNGVSKADWNTKSKILTVTFDPATTNMDLFGKKIASAGHDNAKAKAFDTAYNTQPDCCKYR